MGIIERVEMIDFMCHTFLKFNFGPQINFIIGVYSYSARTGMLNVVSNYRRS
jgi:hypothetical protein